MEVFERLRYRVKSPTVFDVVLFPVPPVVAGVVDVSGTSPPEQPASIIGKSKIRRQVKMKDRRLAAVMQLKVLDKSWYRKFILTPSKLM
jgi:hypothetical protein